MVAAALMSILLLVAILSTAASAAGGGSGVAEDSAVVKGGAAAENNVATATSSATATAAVDSGGGAATARGGAVAAAVAVGGAAVASAAEVAIGGNTGDTIEKRYEYEAGSEPVIEDYLLVDGVRYELDSVTAPVVMENATPSVYFIHEESVIILPERFEQGNLETLFARSFPIEADGYRGTIPLVDLSVREFAVIIEEGVEHEVALNNLPNNDLIQIPMTHDFEVSSAEGKDSTELVTFKFLGIEWERTSAGYTATVTYRGLAHDVVVNRYEVTARFEGVVAYDTNRFAVEASYASPVVVIGDFAAPLGMEEGDIVPVLAVAALTILVLLALAWLSLYFLLFRRNVKLMASEYAEGAGTCIYKKTVKVQGEEALLVIPASIELMDGRFYWLELKPRLALQQGEMLVKWREGMIARAQIALRIDLNIAAVLAGVIGGLLDDDEDD
jgi:hypothetical protein